MASFAEVTFHSPHGGHGWELGACLWSPERAEDGADRYAVMRAPEAGDIIYHWVAGMPGEPRRRRFLWGRSEVVGPARTLRHEPPEPDEWAGRGSYYRIDLRRLQRLSPPAPLEDFEDAVSRLILLEVGRDRQTYYPYVRYRDGFRVAQGIYLTLLSSALAEASNAFFAPNDRDEDGASDTVARVDRVRAYAEGERYRREANFFRRNPRLRREAIERHGLKCAVCAFDFGQQYGEHGQGFIEVHHLRGLAEQRDLAAGAMIETTADDVIPLCANCRRMAHRGRSVLPLDELKEMWRAKHVNAE